MRFSVVLLLVFASCVAAAQEPPAESESQRSAEIQHLKLELQKISARLDQLEQQQAHDSAMPQQASQSDIQKSSEPASIPAVAPAPPVLSAEDRASLSFLRGTTLNFGFDGYYANNFNYPVGRVNQLRAYDVSSNSFSINQATLMVEHLPRPVPNQRFGGRIDLQFGQATETLQGSSANEFRPEVWRNLFQAYGSYIAPIGSGLQFDFGKWASALGVEGNYTKDQINYSRSFLFNYLPYYHMGLRANYNVTPRVNVAYWLVNGAQQTEDFNGFKSQALITSLKPATSLTWNINYYFGDEQPDVVANINGTFPTKSITPTPNGREHIFDTYATWTPTKHLTFVGEADFVINRVYSSSQPKHVAAGAFYIRYALPHNYNLAARTEYFDDRNGFFTNTSQSLKEFTFTLNRQIEPGFLAFVEYRRDGSNQSFFTTGVPGSLTQSQPTATVGLVYAWGQKQGSW